MTLEQQRPRTQRGAGRTVAWLAKQAELGLAGLDLSLAQYRVLGLLSEGSAVSSAIAERLAVRPPSVTALIDGLEARGLVERCTIEGDRRRVSLVVTPEGRRAIAAADAALDARLSAIAAMLGDEDGGEGAVAGLARWTAAMRAYHEARHRGER